jgi:hypothetical protein
MTTIATNRSAHQSSRRPSVAKSDLEALIAAAQAIDSKLNELEQKARRKSRMISESDLDDRSIGEMLSNILIAQGHCGILVGHFRSFSR